MQYVRSISGSVSKTWNSINPATLSGAIDVIVIEQEDGSLKCSPFHVRFGKFSLLRPYEKKVEFRVNDVKQDYAMKLGEGGEAFFVFETSDDIPESLQTSPLVSPAISPQSFPVQDTPTAELQEPDFLDLTTEGRKSRTGSSGAREVRRPIFSAERRAQSELNSLTPSSASPDRANTSPPSGEWANTTSLRPAPLERSTSEEALPRSAEAGLYAFTVSQSQQSQTSQPRSPSVESITLGASERSNSPPPIPIDEAVNRAMKLSRKLSDSNIRTKVTETGDLMLDMTGFKSTEEDALRAELIARKILAEELEGNYDIGSLIGADDQGNLWIYSSQEAKEIAQRKVTLQSLHANVIRNSDAASDPGYHSDDGQSAASAEDSVPSKGLPTAPVPDGLITPPKSPPEAATVAELSRNYAKTLRLTSDQLKALRLKRGMNTMSFNVNRATCQAYMYYWTHDVPIVVSDIDGTITKSDALGHVLNMIGRDWTHIGVAKLYTDIVSNGYNIMYLTSRSVGQADTTRAYLKGVSQEGFKLPQGPVIMSPDRTIAALRREIYLRKPEVFKMACLRDIQSLFSPNKNLFYAGFGNRLTDALSYRSVNIPSRRIFTINSNAEVSLDHLSLKKYKSSYVSMRELVDHFFPAVGLLVTGGGEEFTDFNYWRSPPLELEDFSASESEDGGTQHNDQQSLRSEDEGSEGLDGSDQGNDLADSYLSRESYDETEDLIDSILESMEGADITENRIPEEKPVESETTVVTDDSPPQAEHDTVSAHTKKDSTGMKQGNSRSDSILFEEPAN